MTEASWPELTLDGETFLLALTGAGVSAESGVPTFRDAGGLWEQHRFEDVASPEGFRRDPGLVWRFYSQRREGAAQRAPNPGHAALAAVERRLGERFLLATQNVDGLHARAGSRRVVELHGSLFRTRCSACDRPAFEDDLRYDHAPACERCAREGRRGLLRPDIVWFGEALAAADLERVEAFMHEARRGRFLFLAAGTSGAVYPAAGLVRVARALGAETFLVNLEAADNTTAFHHFLRGPSGRVLPAILGVG